MSTRSYICKQVDSGKYEGIYCHFDGYISGVGDTLDHYYDTKEKVDALIALGNISSLEETLEDTKAKAYGGEDEKPFILTSEEIEALGDSDIEFVYCYEANGLWRVYMVYSQTWAYLPDALKAQGIEPKFAKNWDEALAKAKDGDAYDQMKQAEKEGVLTDLLFQALDVLDDSEYEPLKKRWSEVWASHKFYTEDK